MLKVTVFKSHSPGWQKPEYWVSVAHDSNQKDRCSAIVPAAVFTHKQIVPNAESQSGCLTLAALD